MDSASRPAFEGLPAAIPNNNNYQITPTSATLAQSNTQDVMDTTISDVPRPTYQQEVPTVASLSGAPNAFSSNAISSQTDSFPSQQPPPRSNFSYLSNGIITMPRYTPNQYYGEPSNIGHQLDYIPGGGRGRSFAYPHARTLSLSQNQHSGLPAYPQRDPRSSNTQPTMSRTMPGSVSGVSPGDGSPNTPDLTSSTAVVPPALRPRGYVPPSARTQQGTQHPAPTAASPVPTSSSYYQQSQAQQHSHTAGPFSHLPPHPEEFDDGAYIAPLVTTPAQSSSANFVTTGTPPSRSMNAGNSRYGRPLPQRLELARRAHLLGHHYNPQAAQAIVEAHMQLQRQRQRQRQGLGTHPTKPSASLDNAKDGRPEPKEAHEMRVSLECKVCFTQLVDTVLLPCGHAVLCRWCAEIQIPNSILERGLLGGQPPCVICRAPVKQKVKADVGDFPGSLTIAHTDLGTQVRIFLS